MDLTQSVPQLSLPASPQQQSTLSTPVPTTTITTASSTPSTVPDSSHLMVKIRYGNDIRRVTLSKKAPSKLSLLLKELKSSKDNPPAMEHIPTSHNELLSLVFELFPSLKQTSTTTPKLKSPNSALSSSPSSFGPVIKYLDDENDLVTITSSRELQEALAFALKPAQGVTPLLRLFVFKTERDVPRSCKSVQFDIPEEEDACTRPSASNVCETARECVDYTITNVPWYEHQQIHRHNRLLGRFVADVTVPNGTVMLPKAEFVKTWRMRNEGKSRWPENTTLVFVGGDLLSKGSVKSICVPSAEPGAEVELSVDMEAPSKPGRYMSYWRLCHPSGKRFGQRIWVHVRVEDPNAPAPSLSDSCLVVPGADIPCFLMGAQDTLPVPPVNSLPDLKLGTLTFAKRIITSMLTWSSDINNNNNCLPTTTTEAATNQQPSVKFVRNPIYDPAYGRQPAESPVPVVPPEASAQVPEEEPLTPMDQLRAMGFADVELNKKMLENHKNDLVSAISELLLQ